MSSGRTTVEDKHMGVAEVKRHFADVMAEVVYTKRRIVVERRGRPMVAIVPLDTPVDARTPGQRLAAVIGFGGEEGDRFYEEMLELIPRLRSDLPREVPEVNE
jgi:prevent-host-death family protein